MSRQKLKARDKVFQKNVCDGLVQRNEATGEDMRISKREAEFELHGKAPERETLSKVRQQTDNASSKSSFAAKKPQTKQRIDNSGKPATEAVEPSTCQEALVNKPDAPRSDKPGKLQFTTDEIAPDTLKIHHNRKPGKAQRQAGNSVKEPKAAQPKLPQKRKLRAGRISNEKTGASKHKLYFESTIKSGVEHLKGPLSIKPAKAAVNSAFIFGHRKMFQVERENAGTEAVHRGEMLAEGVIRSALRFRKTAPYREVEGLERKAVKKSVNLNQQQYPGQNPKLKSNMLNRAIQKRKIRKDYAKAAREAQRAAKQAQKAGSAAAKVGRTVAAVAKRHPIAAIVVILIAFLLFTLMSLFGAFGGIGSGSFGGILSASYLAEDEDIDKAELVYTQCETGLREQIANAESTYPSYDEYRYNIGEIGHDPFGLMAYLTVKYQNFTYDAVEADLREIFDEQYTLTFTASVETRYRTVTKTDPVTGENYKEKEAYDWHVLTVGLAARPFGDVVIPRLSSEEYTHYSLLLQTKGSRQYLSNPFGFDWLPNITSYYGYRIHPISGVVDLHRGLDIGVPQGTEIHSGQDGTVMFAGWSGDYGNVAVIDDGKGLVSKYAHCETLLVSKGQTVAMGDVIATVGSTGNSTGPHLHLEVLKDGIYYNPIFFTFTGSFSI